MFSVREGARTSSLVSHARTRTKWTEADNQSRWQRARASESTAGLALNCSSSSCGRLQRVVERDSERQVYKWTGEGGGDGGQVNLLEERASVSENSRLNGGRREERNRKQKRVEENKAKEEA